MCRRYRGRANASQFCSELYDANPEFKRVLKVNGGLQGFCSRHASLKYIPDRDNGSVMLIEGKHQRRRHSDEPEGLPYRAGPSMSAGHAEKVYKVGASKSINPDRHTTNAFWNFLCSRAHLKSTDRCTLQGTFEQWLARKCALEMPTDNFTAVINVLQYQEKLHTVGNAMVYGPRPSQGDSLGSPEETSPADSGNDQKRGPPTLPAAFITISGLFFLNHFSTNF